MPNDITSLSFEQALNELETIVNQLEKGQIELEQAITSYTRGSQLRVHCEQKLAQAKLKIEKLATPPA